jgi:hypothetical protein
MTTPAKGPWTYRRATASRPTYHVRAPTVGIIATLHGEREAEARLIASAPTLSTAARRSLDYVLDMKRFLKAMKLEGTVQYEMTEAREAELRTAINRATGTSKGRTEG